MARPQFRFLHASDLHLEQPLGGLEDVPNHLRELLIDAPYAAAAKLFETATIEQVAFVLLAGDVLDVRRAGARGLAFLLEQFRLLDECGIPVYWAGGAADNPEHWPVEAPLPSNVQRFPADRVETIVHEVDGEPLATIVGRSWASPERIRAAQYGAEGMTIAVAYGRGDAERMQRQEVRYWALGGRHQRKTLFTGEQVAHYAGSCQGRSPAESGAHGGTLVTVSEQQSLHLDFVPTDQVRWHTERVALSDHIARGDLELLLHDRIRNLQSDAGARQVLLQLELECDGRLAAELRRGRLRLELLQALRQEFGQTTPGVWTVSLEVPPPEQLQASWYEEDTILGDYLRTLAEYQADAEQPLELEQFLPEGQPDELLSMLAELPRSRREVILREAALLGAELLRGTGSDRS